MSHFEQRHWNLGRSADGGPEVQYRFWKANEADFVEWRDLTNEEIIVAVTTEVIVAVVLQDKTQDNKLKKNELDMINQLFNIFSEANEDNLDSKVFFCHVPIMCYGESCISPRCVKIDAELQRHLGGSSYHPVIQELIKTHERIVTAQFSGSKYDCPVVVGGYVLLPGPVVDHSLGYPGPSFEG